MNNNDEGKQGIALNINLDTTPVFYTDNVLMTTNEDGLVLDICQKFVNTNQAKVVARVGMSREHAKKFVQTLGTLLIKSEGQGQTGKIGTIN